MIIIMKGELTGMVALGCYDIQITGYRDEPSYIYAYATQLYYGQIETRMGIANYRFTDNGEENEVEMMIPCTTEEHEVAAQCDRFYMITPEEDNTRELPAILRKFGSLIVSTLG